MGIDEPGLVDQQAQQRLIEFGRAVGDPTRVAILAELTRSDGMTVAELTRPFGLHHSAIRTHLRVLEAAGLVSQDDTPAVGRGRPAKVFRVLPGALERWGLGGGPHVHLTTMLVDMVGAGAEAGAAGQRVGRALAAAFSELDPVGRVAAVTRVMGFEPSRPEVHGEQLRFTLHACPFVKGVRAAPGLVCGLHRAVAEGATGPGWVVRDLIAVDPERAGCQLVLAPVAASA